MSGNVGASRIGLVSWNTAYNHPCITRVIVSVEGAGIWYDDMCTLPS